MEQLIRSIIHVYGCRTTVKPNNLINPLQNFAKSGTIYAVQIKKHTAKQNLPQSIKHCVVNFKFAKCKSQHSVKQSHCGLIQI